MQLKVLTANIGLGGLPRLDNLFYNALAHLVFHGTSMVNLFLRPKSLKNKVNRISERNVRYLKKRTNLKPSLSLIKQENPDVVMLNEVIIQFNKEELQASLTSLGYQTIAFGHSNHYPNATVATIIASKEKAEVVTIDFPQGHHAGGGGGIASLRFPENKIVIIAAHFSAACFPWLYDAQIEAAAHFINQEVKNGYQVVIGGDWNAPSSFIRKYPSFEKLGLLNADNDMLTCPTFLPKLQPLDHIFISKNFQIIGCKTVFFGSDHLALIADFEIKK